MTIIFHRETVNISLMQEVENLIYFFNYHWRAILKVMAEPWALLFNNKKKYQLLLGCQERTSQAEYQIGKCEVTFQLKKHLLVGEAQRTVWDSLLCCHLRAVDPVSLKRIKLFSLLWAHGKAKRSNPTEVRKRWKRQCSVCLRSLWF